MLARHPAGGGDHQRLSPALIWPCLGHRRPVVERRFEFDSGDEIGAGLTDRFEVTVEFDWSGAIAVAEHPVVHLGPKLTHFGSLVVGVELSWLVVKRFNFFGDSEVWECQGGLAPPC